MKKYILENEYLKLTILEIGASVFSLIKKDTKTNLVFSLKEKEYLKNEEFHGAIVGPSSGRICKQSVEINGKNYTIPNFKDFLLHSGKYKICEQKWKLEKRTKNKVSFSFFYKNDELPFLSKQKVVVTYKLFNKEVTCLIKSFSNEEKIMNYTNHTYFTLGENDIRKLLLKIEHEKLIDVKENGFVTGKIFNEWNNDLNFKKYKNTKNIDHPFILKRKGKIYLKNPKNHVSLEIKTNQNALVVYNDCKSPKKKYKAIALECQGIPDAISNKSWPQNISRKKVNKTIWKFSW